MKIIESLILIICFINQSKTQIVNLTIISEEFDKFFMNEALNEALLSLSQGGIPVGSVIVVDKKIIGRGHNMRVQTGSPIQHAEMNALENAGRLTADVYKNATLYTTLSPCSMCTGAVNLYGISRVVIGDNINFKSEYGENLLKKKGVKIDVLNDQKIVKMMTEFIKNHPELWNEDIGKEESCFIPLNKNLRDLNFKKSKDNNSNFSFIFFLFPVMFFVIILYSIFIIKNKLNS